MQEISMDKKYKTKSGKPVRILAIDVKGTSHPVLALILSGDGKEIVHGFTSTGRYTPERETEIDLVEVTPYVDFKIDDKVLVWDHGDDRYKKKRYFAGISEDGHPQTFSAGKTSWTANGDVTDWDFCEKAE